MAQCSEGPPRSPVLGRACVRETPSAWGLRRRRPGTVFPNEVIFMRRDVCGKVKGSGRKGNRETQLAGGKGTVHFSDCLLTLGWGGTWEGKDPGWWWGERGRRGWGWTSLGLAKLQGLGPGAAGGLCTAKPWSSQGPAPTRA